MKEYKGFKIGDNVKHKFRDKRYQNCEITEIREDRLPLIDVIDLETGEAHLFPYMDIALNVSTPDKI
jgi:hypothetical protein